MAGDIRVHIGVHRTGTTAVQTALASRRAELQDAGTPFGHGAVLADNHIELAIAALRPDRLLEATPFLDHLIRQNAPDRPSATDPAWTEIAHEIVADQPTVILSTETLAWIRHDDEVQRLLEALGATPRIVVVHRRPDEFLESYFQMIRFATLEPPNGPDSLFYCEPDSWLADRGARVGLWRRGVGDDHVIDLDYDQLMTDEGSSAGAVARALGVTLDAAALDATRNVNSRQSFPTKGTGGRD